jgi:flavodoxin I
MQHTDTEIALIFGTDTGITEEISNLIVDKWSKTKIEMIEVSDITIDDFNKHQYLILGLSTWYDGDLQSDWESYLDEFKTIKFENKFVAIFGLGDQVGYGEYFIDGVGILAEIVIENGGKIIGNWPIDGYNFSESKALVNDTYFYGLAIDEDTQSNQTNNRVDQWLKILEKEFKL